MKVIVFEGFWTVDDCKKNSNYLFIFGDNDIKKGKKGQAVIRDEKNAIGIPTKKLPNFQSNAYYTDNEYIANCYKIDDSIENILKILKNEKYEGIILPENGIGTGLANLNKCAPKTLEYINKKSKELIKCVENMSK